VAGTGGSRAAGLTVDDDVRHLTVLYDGSCGMCTGVQGWLEGQALLVACDLVPAGSPEARRRFPHLDHAATLEEVTVVADTGEVWTGDAAWVVCLWATVDHRALAQHLSGSLRPLVRAAARTANGLR